MPWQVKDVDRFKKGLTNEEKKKWVTIANKALEQCLEKKGSEIECEASAIKIANSRFSEENNHIGFSLALQEAEVTDDYQLILPIGVFYSSYYGEIIITESFCEALVDNWKNKVLGERQPFVDTEHDRGKANGWILDLQVRDDGLYAKIDWTDMGRENVEKGYYRYFSADIDETTDINTGEKVWPVLIAVALTNKPVMNNMPPAHLSDKNPAHGDGDINNKSGGDYMTLEEILEKLKTLSLNEEGKKKIAELVGLSLEDKKEEDRGKLELSEKVKLQDEKIKLLLDENKTLSQKLSAIEKEQMEKKKEEVIQKALSEGKILPKNKEKWEAMFEKDPKGTELLLAEKGKEVDLTEHGSGAGGGEKITLSETEAKYHQAFGHSEEDIKKYGGE